MQPMTINCWWGTDLEYFYPHHHESHQRAGDARRGLPTEGVEAAYRGGVCRTTLGLVFQHSWFQQRVGEDSTWRRVYLAVFRYYNPQHHVKDAGEGPMWSGTAVCLRLRGPHNLSFSTAGFNMSTRDLCRVEYLSGQVRTIGLAKPPTELAVVNESECVFRTVGCDRCRRGLPMWNKACLHYHKSQWHAGYAGEKSIWNVAETYA